MYPRAIQIGPLSINGYGLMVALGFLFGLWTASRRSPRDGIASEKILDLGPWLIIGAIVGARILYVITFWREQFAGEPWYEVFKVWRGGLVYYGGLIGASLACIIYARWKQLPLWKTGDVMAPSIALGQVFGRIGCLLNGCCYGCPTTVPWAIRYPSGHETHPAGSLGAAVHPTQIYEAVGCLLLYLGLAWWFRRRKSYDGQVFGLFLVGYAIVRSVDELFRGDYPRNQLFFGGATPGQMVSLFILITGIILLLALRARRPAEPQPQA